MIWALKIFLTLVTLNDFGNLIAGTGFAHSEKIEFALRGIGALILVVWLFKNF